MAINKIGIDLGSSKTNVYVENKGVVLSEPTLVAVDNKSGLISSGGINAKALIEKSPEKYIAIEPISKGLISEYDAIERLINYFVFKAGDFSRIIKPPLVISVPSQVSEVEKKAVIEAGKKGGGRSVDIVFSPVMVALGGGLDLMVPKGYLVIDIGSDTTDIAVVFMGAVVNGYTLKLGSSDFEVDIINYIDKHYKISVDRLEAVNIKHRVSDAVKSGHTSYVDFKGVDIITGNKVSKSINPNELIGAMLKSHKVITDSILMVLKRTNADLISDISSNGIFLGGGGSLMSTLVPHIEKNVGLVCTIFKNPKNVAAEGMGVFMKDYKSLVCYKDNNKRNNWFLPW